MIRRDARPEAGPGSPPGSARAIDGVVFDLGGVLIDWDPRLLYRRLLPDDAAVEEFLATVCTSAWNARQDAGRPWSDAIAELVAAYPAQRDLIVAYRERWSEMLGGAIEGSVAVLAELRAAGVPLYALSNWAADTFEETRLRYDFLGWFERIVVSGAVGAAKPDPRVYRWLLDACGLDPRHLVYVDDLAANVRVAEAFGMHGIVFTGAASLRDSLGALGLLGGRTGGAAVPDATSIDPVGR